MDKAEQSLMISVAHCNMFLFGFFAGAALVLWLAR